MVQCIFCTIVVSCLNSKLSIPVVRHRLAHASFFRVPTNLELSGNFCEPEKVGEFQIWSGNF